MQGRVLVKSAGWELSCKVLLRCAVGFIILADLVPTKLKSSRASEAGSTSSAAHFPNRGLPSRGYRQLEVIWWVLYAYACGHRCKMPKMTDSLQDSLRPVIDCAPRGTPPTAHSDLTCSLAPRQ